MNLVSELQEQINFNDNYKDWLYSLNIDEDPQLTCLAAFKTLREQIEQLKKARDDMREVVMVKMDTLFRNYRANGNSKLDKKSFDSKVLGELRGKDHVPALELDISPFEDDFYLGGAYDYSMDYSIPAYPDWEPVWEKDNGGFNFDLPDLKDLEGLCDTAEFEYLNGRLFEIAQLFGWEQKANDRLDEILS